MTNSRVDVVIFTFGDAGLFLHTLGKIDLDLTQDRLIVLDAAGASSRFVEEIHQCFEGGQGRVLIFGRCNWNLNHGGQLDYLRLIHTGVIDPAENVFFMQDHYLNLVERVKGDTVDPQTHVNLQSISSILKEDPYLVLHASRDKYKFSAPSGDALLLRKELEFHEDDFHQALFPLVDGANFSCTWMLLAKAFPEDSPWLRMHGPGTYSFCHVWEHRIHQVLYESGAKFRHLGDDFGYRNVTDLIERGLVSTIFLEGHFKVYFALYGKDVHHYRWTPALIFGGILVLLREARNRSIGKRLPWRVS